MTNQVYRGQIYYADLSPSRGCEQGGIRPVLVIQNNVGNKHSPTTIVAPLTTKLKKTTLPTHVDVKELSGRFASLVLLEQIRVIDKERLKDFLCCVGHDTMEEVDNAIKVSLGLT